MLVKSVKKTGFETEKPKEILKRGRNEKSDKNINFVFIFILNLIYKVCI
jgi:hypothetical protein